MSAANRLKGITLPLRFAERNPRPMKMDPYAEMYLWNRNIDGLVRVLQRLELFSIRTKQELKTYEIRLEEIRAGLNADLSETMAARERADEFRLWSWRTGLEKQTKKLN
jgi:hypothetical protein